MTDWFGAEDHVDRALEFYQRGRWAEAEAELRKALEVSPDRGEWQFNLGLTLEAAGRESEAVVCYRRAADLMPGEPDPLVAIGLVSNRLGDHQRAIESLEESLRLDAQNDLAYACLIDSFTCLHRHDDAETTFYLAQQHLEESPRTLAAVAESLMIREAWSRADWCLREALRLEPTLPRVRARLAAVLAETGRPERAVQMYRRELRDDPGSVATLLDFGDLLAGLNRLPEAAEKFRRVLELEPANVDAHVRLGDLAVRSGRYDEAHVEFELVVKLEPAYPDIRLRLAETLVARGRAGEARRYLLAELDEVGRGVLAASDRERPDHETDRRADEPDPRDSIDLLRLGGLLLAIDEPRRATFVLERAAREHEDAETFRKLALARFRCGDRVGGMTSSRRVLRFDRNCVRSLHNLALASLESGQLQRASVWIRRGLRFDANDEGLRRLRSRLWIARLLRRVGR